MSSDVRLVLVDRLFLLLDGLQGSSSLNLYALSLDADLALQPFRLALADLLAEQPLLRTRAKRTCFGLQRRIEAHQDLEAVLTVGTAAEGVGWGAAEELAFMRAPLDLASQAPVR